MVRGKPPYIITLLSANNSLRFTLDEFAGDDDLIDAFLGGELKHEVHHKLLHNSAESACARIFSKRVLGDSFKRAVVKCELDLVHTKQLHVLLDNRVFGVSQNSYQRVAVKIGECNDNGQTSHKLGYKTELDNIVRNDGAVNTAGYLLCLLFDVAAKADSRAADSLFDYLVKTVEGTAADKENVLGIDLDKFLIGVLASALRRYV